MTAEMPELNSFIHRFIPAQQANLPTLLLLHGTGGNEDDLLDLGRMLMPGAALLSPRGKVLEHGMSRFFRRLAEGVFDIPDLIARTHELADFVQTASTAYHFDPARVIAVGFSNGANIAASMLLLRPSALSAAILSHAMVTLEPEQLPDLEHKPVFMGSSRIDPLIPPDNTERLVTLLQRAGAEVSLHWFNGGHTITHEEVRHAKVWLSNIN
jgi:phospholipase/carboxylesterase/glyoxalase family protein